MKFKKTRKPLMLKPIEELETSSSTFPAEISDTGDLTASDTADDQDEGMFEINVAEISQSDLRAEPAPALDFAGQSMMQPSTIPPPVVISTPARLAYPLAVGLSATWAVSAVMFAIGYQSQDWAFEFKPNQMLLLSLVVVLPAIMLAISAYSIRQGAEIAGQARRARKATDDMVAPVVLAVGETGNVLATVRAEIERTVGATQQATRELSELRNALMEESDRMAETVASAERAARLLTERLGNERLEMGILSAEMESRAAMVTDTIQRQSRMVSEASDLASTQIREAESALAARAADLAAAAADAGELSALAGQQLSLNAERLETVSETVGERLGALWTGMAREREHFEGLAENLHVQQTEVIGKLGVQRSQLIDAVAQARVGAQEIGSAAGQGADALRRLIAEAATQVGALAETARAEQEAMDQQARSRLRLFAEAVSEERAIIEDDSRAAVSAIMQTAKSASAVASATAATFRDATVGGAQEAIEQLTAAAQTARETAKLALAESAAAANAHTEAARNRLENIGEIAFQAGKKADEIFDSRFAAARRMIEESTRLVDEAGLRSAQKMEANLAATRETAQEIAGLIDELAAHAGGLPGQAHANVEAVRSAVARGVDDLANAARRAAEQTHQIDVAFQERVRQNYEMLSASVREMTQVAGGADTAARAQPEPAPLIEVPVTAPPPEMEASLVRARALDASAVEIEEPRRAVVGGGGVGDRGVRFPIGAGRSRSEASRGDQPRDADDEPPLELNVTAAKAGLRPRLRLTMTDEDRDLKSVFEPARTERRPSERSTSERSTSERPPSARPSSQSASVERPAANRSETSDEWTWRDLLKNMDGGKSGPDEALASSLQSEIEALGVDSAALLPRSRIEEIARSLGEGDLDAGRDAVRRLAPAAIRRLSRRMETDQSLRVDSQRFVSRFGNLVVDALTKEDGAAAALLSAPQGRAFLLLDAAVSPQG